MGSLVPISFAAIREDMSLLNSAGGKLTDFDIRI